MKLTADGDEAWKQVGTLAHDDEITEATLDVTADGQYLLTLEGLYVLDTTGETVWDRPTDGWLIYDAIATSDGGTAWIASQAQENEDGGTYYEDAGRIVKTDDGGTIQWHETYEDTPGNGRQIAERESGFVVAGQTDGSQDANGDLVVRDGTYVVGGTSDPHSDDTWAAAIAKCSVNGDGDSGTPTATEPPETTTTEPGTATETETQTDTQTETETPTPSEGTETDED